MIDTRPEIEPEFYAYRELPEDLEDALPLWREMSDLMRGGAQPSFGPP